MSLMMLPWLLSDTVHVSMILFIVIYGLDWVAPVPPTVALCNSIFGDSGTIVFGWVFAAHRIGAACAALGAGVIRDAFGEYTYAWLAGAAICAIAAALGLCSHRSHETQFSKPWLGSHERGIIVDSADAPDQAEDSSLTSPEERFAAAKAEFDALIQRDFPNFSVEQYAAAKAANEGIETEDLADRLWAEAQKFPARLDLSGDGKLGFDDASIAAKLAGEQIGKAWDTVTDIDAEDVAAAAASAKQAVTKAGKRVLGFDYRGAFQKAAKNIQDAVDDVDADTFRAGGRTLSKIGKTAFGIQGLQDRKEATNLKRVGEEYAAAAEAVTDQRREELNSHIEAFGALRLEALHETLGRFLRILEALEQKNRVKEYELLDGLGIDTKSLEAMAELDMTVTQSLRSTAMTGALGTAAVLGTPALVTSAVAAFATASTGTAISSLSGVAATNAVMAWLGGGSLAAGGGGMAAGTVVLTGITAGATAGVTLLAAGILVSTHYARKLTEAKDFQKEAALAVASLENAWVAMDGIVSRVDELSSVTEELRDRLVPLLTELEGLVPVFDSNVVEHATVFNQCGQLVKTMVELAQIPLLGSDGELSDESMTITTRVRTVLNTEIKQ